MLLYATCGYVSAGSPLDTLIRALTQGRYAETHAEQRDFAPVTTTHTNRQTCKLAYGGIGSIIKPAKGVTMQKYRVASMPAAQKESTYSEGKQAFTKGDRRGYNPYAANNLALATIWWNGWDTGEEESHAVQPARRKA